MKRKLFYTFLGDFTSLFLRFFVNGFNRYNKKACSKKLRYLLIVAEFNANDREKFSALNKLPCETAIILMNFSRMIGSALRPSKGISLST
ncbi:MAG: hypothetical protein WCO63_08320 [Bacteroidota bacterium]